MTARDPEVFIWAMCVVGVAAIALAVVLPRLLRKARPAAVAVAEPAPSHRAPSEPVRVEDAAPLCDCGWVADRSAPEIIPHASWIDVARRWLGFAPRYTIRVPTGESEAAPVFCQVHGRAADVFVDEELAVAVVVERKAAESRIVQRVAAFITSGLRARVLESLTKEQQSALKNRGKVRPAPLAEVVPISRAANDRGEA